MIGDVIARVCHDRCGFDDCESVVIHFYFIMGCSIEGVEVEDIV